MPDLLIELLSEEIPARMQARACDDLKRLVTDGLVAAGLTYASAGAFATPRRLALSVEGLVAESPTLREERKGPRTDAPASALDGFLRATGLNRDQLETRQDKKGEFFFAMIEHAGRPAADIVAEVLGATIRTFPWPKSMRWGAGSLKWVRPLQSILCILSDESGATVVPLDVDGITSGDTTQGHRFMAPGSIKVSGFEDYGAKLIKAHVVLDAAARADHIWADATNLAFAQGCEVVEDKALLAEIAGLVEWPVVLMGAIGADFLDLPPEVLQTSMREHQKFFSVRNPKSGRIERFITVANRETADNGATILAGYQKVLAARLSDARFFWDNDLRASKKDRSEWLNQLALITFHSELGTQAERISRFAPLAALFSDGAKADPKLSEQAARVAKCDLSSEMVHEFPELQGLMGKYYLEAAGLPSEVALASLEHYSPLGPSDAVPTAPVSVAVALADKTDTLASFWAIDEKPTGSKDPYALRRAALSVIRLIIANSIKLSLLEIISDHIFSLWHSFNYGEVVYGSDDLFGHRDGKRGGDSSPATFWHTGIFQMHLNNNSLGALFERYTHYEQLRPKFKVEEIGNNHPDELVKLRTEIQDFYDLLMYWKINEADESSEFKNSVKDKQLASEIYFSGQAHIVANNLLAFFHDRLKVYLRDQGVRHDVIDAGIAMPNNDDLTLLVKRATALSDFLKTDDGENLLQGFKRANNILIQAEEKDGVEYSYGADKKFADSPEEKSLFAALDREGGAISSAIEAEDFAAAMSGMAALRKPIDAFFDAVQVNTDNDIIRRNRLNLLGDIRKLCLSVADLTRIEG